MDLIQEAESLQQKLNKNRAKLNDVKLKIISNRLKNITSINIEPKRSMKGNEAKMVCCDWAPDNRHILTASQDGKLRIWDTLKCKVKEIVTMPETLITCAFKPTGNMAVSGGLHLNATVFKIYNDEKDLELKLYFTATHKSFVTCSLFSRSANQLFTGSADPVLTLWDLGINDDKDFFYGHTGDIMCVDQSPSNDHLFVTGGCDKMMLLWDDRINQHVQSFIDKSAINSVKFHPGGDAVVCASDDATCRLYDIRAEKEVALYAKKSILFGVNSVDFSISGRLLFGGYADSTIHVWDTLMCKRVGILRAHKNYVSSLKFSPDGTSLATTSWDASLRIWN